MANYTVAKVTMECLFDSKDLDDICDVIEDDDEVKMRPSGERAMWYKLVPIEVDGKDYLATFIGVTYHCS